MIWIFSIIGRPSPPALSPSVASSPVHVDVSEEPNGVERTESALPVTSEASPASFATVSETIPVHQISALPNGNNSDANQSKTAVPVASSEPLGKLHKADDNSLAAWVGCAL